MFVVVGASGNTGKVVAETLLRQKKKVRVVLHDAAKGTVRGVPISFLVGLGSVIRAGCVHRASGRRPCAYTELSSDRFKAEAKVCADCGHDRRRVRRPSYGAFRNSARAEDFTLAFGI
jgi:hypothetical protein